jgi:hypothetical protein
MPHSIRSLAFCLAISALPARALDVALLDDTVTTSYTPNSAAGGTALTLMVNGATSGTNANKRAWIKFDLNTALPAGTTYAQITKATLRVFVNTVGTSGPVSVYAATGAWDEATLSHNTSPGWAGDPGNSNAPYDSKTPFTPNEYCSFDVTELVRDWKDGTLANNGIVLVAGATYTSVNIDSKEATAESHPASLHIVLAGAQGPQGIQGVQGSVGPAGPTGPQGAAGNSVLNGSGDPYPGIGSVGDFYINSTTHRIHGPKTANGWPNSYTATSMIGPVGPQGPVGPVATRVSEQGNLSMGIFRAGTPP